MIIIIYIYLRMCFRLNIIISTFLLSKRTQFAPSWITLILLNLPSSKYFRHIDLASPNNSKKLYHPKNRKSISSYKWIAFNLNKLDVLALLFDSYLATSIYLPNPPNNNTNDKTPANCLCLLLLLNNML